MHDDRQNSQFYSGDQEDTYASTAQQPRVLAEMRGGESIKWTASEFVHHDKNIAWYLGLAVAILGIAVAVYLILNRDIFTLVIIVVFGVVFGIAAARKPRVLEYSVDDFGLTVGQKRYWYEDFKSFALDKDSAISSLIFMPTKRFGPSLTLYIPADNLDEILDLVGMYLPFEQYKTGYVDKFLSRIRF